MRVYSHAKSATTKKALTFFFNGSHSERQSTSHREEEPKATRETIEAVVPTHTHTHTYTRAHPFASITRIITPCTDHSHIQKLSRTWYSHPYIDHPSQFGSLILWMAVEFVEGQCSNKSAHASSHCGGGGGGGAGLGAIDDGMLLLDDWATDEPEQLFRTEVDENMTSMWNMDSIDVVSCFAGEPSHHNMNATTDAVPSGSGEHAVHAGGDALFAQMSWWDPSANSGHVGEGKLKQEQGDEVLAGHPSMSPLAMPIKQVVSQTVSVGGTDKDVTDALLAVFAPHAILSDDSQTDSGSESSHQNHFSPVVVSRADSSTSSTSSFVIITSQDSSSLPPAASSTGKGKRAAKKQQQQEVAWDEKDLTPLEIRRKRNRESMQRARRRQRDDVEEMKETLQELEAHYQKLSDQAQERRKEETRTREQQRLESDYYTVADLSHTLKEEKFMLEQMLTDKQKTYRRMQQVMVDRVQELELPCPTTTTPATLFSDFEFTPVTEESANELIRRCYQQILQFQDAATPLTPPRGMKAETKPKPKSERSAGTMVTSNPFPPTATFGWKVSCHVTPEKDFFVSFAKYFKGVSAEDAMIASWSRFSDPTKNRAPNRTLLRYEILQEINDSTYVAGVDIQHPVKKDKQMRNIFLRFRMQTEQGFVIGRGSMNPKSPEIRKQAEARSSFEYVDNYSWIEFISRRDEVTGEEGVLVKFNARTEYNTQEDTHLRLVNSLFLTLKWEQAIIPNAGNLFLASS